MKNKSSFAFLLFFAFFSCTGNKIPVVGKWKPVDVDGKYITSYGMSKDDIKNMMENERIEFSKDGKFISFSSHDTVRGIYNYDEKKKQLTTAPQNGKSASFSVELLQNDKIALSNELGRVTFHREE